MNQKALIINWNNCIPDMSKYFDVTGNLGELSTLRGKDVVILWNDVEPAYRGICVQAKGLDILVFCIDHGLELFYPNYWDSIFAADHYLVWAKQSKVAMIGRGCPEERISVVGCPLFRDLPEHTPNGKVVYFPTHELWDGSLPLWNNIKHIDGIKPMVKLLSPDHDVGQYEGEKVVSERFVPLHIKYLYDSLMNASCLITDESHATCVLLACYLDIPIIKPKNHIENCLPSVITEFDLENLEDAVRFALLNPGYLREERQAFAKQHHHGDCAANIYKAVTSIQ